MGTKREKIILSEKLYVIRQMEANPTASQVEMANRLVLAPSSLCKLCQINIKLLKGKLNVV
jgi:hypothetical protein